MAVSFSRIALIGVLVSSVCIHPARGKEAVSLSQREKAIALFEGRIEGKPDDYLNRTILGELYLKKARETDDHACYHKAEVVLREAVDTKPDYKPARLQLAAALQAHHRFREALEIANEVLQSDPGDFSALAVRGDAELELGLYTEAEKTFAELATLKSSPGVLARQARLDELSGKTDAAIERISRALADVKARAGSPATLAWFEWRLAGLYFGKGELPAALDHYKASLERMPEYGPATAGLAEVLAAKGEFSRAVDLLRPLAESTQRPSYMARLGDVLTAKGEDDAASDWYEMAEKEMAAMKVNAEAHYREEALYYADRGKNLWNALLMARKDLSQRKDIYAWDTYAWCLFRNGDVSEAADAVSKALARGTQDARIFYHAGLIQLAAGDKKKADTYLAKALEINPHFSLLHAEDAREKLKALRL